MPRRKRQKRSEDDKVPLPDPFPLPTHYSHDIEVALSRKKMSTNEKQRFISDIASAMLCYKQLPSHDDYVAVARTVIKKYPFIKYVGCVGMGQLYTTTQTVRASIPNNAHPYIRDLNS